MNSSKHNTLVSLFVDRVKADGPKPALFIKRDGQYRTLTWDALARDVGRTAAALVDSGVRPGDRVAQLSENRYEWIILDLAIQLAQGVHVPMHAPLAGRQIADQIIDSGALLVVLSTADQAAKLRPVAERLPDQLQFFSYEPCPEPIGSWPVGRLGEFTRDVDEAEMARLEERALDALGPESLVTILYTSGTTGEPKGVMLNHRNLVSNALATVEAFEQGRDDLKLCFLPLSHIYARTCDLYTWIAQGSQLALAESRETIFANCAELRPTMINGVPYFYQLVQRYLTEQGRADQPGSLRQLFGGRIRCCCSGGAALPVETFDFFQQQGVPLLQGYGLTESSPVISLSSPNCSRRGCVGRAIPGVEVKIAGDGEILTRGPHVMLGFWNNPSATQEVIRDGWLHTGDIGEMDSDGFLKITGRKKELIVTAAGKNVVPTYIESLLCRDSLIEQALVIGDARSYLTALIVPNAQNLRAEIEARHIVGGEPKEALAHANVMKLFQERIGRQLASVSHHEQVRRFTLLDRPFSIERGEMTPKLSLCRKTIEANFAREIAAMYQK